MHNTHNIPVESRTLVTLSGVLCTTVTFFVKYNYSSARGNGETCTDAMRVEAYLPLIKGDEYEQKNVVLVHGEYFDGTTWLNKPDGNSGWASNFLQKGYNVYIPDLPGAGGSFLTDLNNCLGPSDIGPLRELTPDHAMMEYTASEKFPLPNGDFAWSTAKEHTQWPGTGVKDDPFFERLMASTNVMLLPKHKHEQLGKAGLASLLRQIGPSFVAGHGTGATVALLAAEANQRLMRGLVLIEPDGPPCGYAGQLMGGRTLYSPYIQYSASIRPYGVSEIPVAFSPPVAPGPQPLRIQARQTKSNDGCWLGQQIEPRIIIPNMRSKEGQENVPQIIGLAGMSMAILTSESSPHSVYDYATVRFLRQAGVHLDYYDLPKIGVHGNGHLMHLEKNSDVIAEHLHRWMAMTITSEEQERQRERDWANDYKLTHGRVHGFAYNGSRERLRDLEFVVESNGVEPTVGFTAQPNVEPPAAFTTQPNIAESLIAFTTQPNVEPPVAFTAQPNDVESLMAFTTQPNVVETPMAFTTQPNIVEPPMAFTTQHNNVESPVVTAQPNIVEPPMVFAAQPNIVEPPFTTQPNIVESPMAFTGQPNIFEQLPTPPSHPDHVEPSMLTLSLPDLELPNIKNGSDNGRLPTPEANKLSQGQLPDAQDGFNDGQFADLDNALGSVILPARGFDRSWGGDFNFEEEIANFFT
ncbi:Alpha/beta hydrolase family domain-containing protein [Trichoderma austrokoningii]